MGTWGKLASLAGAVGGGALMFVPGGQLAGGALLGASAGLAKHEFEDIPRAQSQMQLAAETARYRPWTGLTPQVVDQPSPVGDIMQGGMTGLTLTQGIKSMGAPAAAATGATASVAGPATAGAAGSVPVVPVNTGPNVSGLQGSNTPSWMNLYRKSLS